jgi:glycosyltransferase involved in cell wall biosynthesis
MRIAKKKLAFVDLSIHKRTKSTEFLIDLFKDQFDVVNIWYDYGKGEKEFIKEIENYDYIFLLQVLLPFSSLIRLCNRKKKVIWAPMYDGLPMSKYYWGKIASTKIKILSFSSGIDLVCKRHNIDYISTRFYKEPIEKFDLLNKTKYTFFFWYRGSIRLFDWLSLIPPDYIDKIYYYSAPLGSSFKNEKIDDLIIKKYKIEKIELNEFSDSRNLFLNFLKKSDIFITPRLQDGIGLPMIEALSYGKYLIGHNDYTMKDYIVHKKNGFLYNFGSSEQIDLSSIQDSLIHRRNFAINGYVKWKKDEQKIKKLYSLFDFSIKPGFSIKVLVISFYETLKSIIKVHLLRKL